MFPDFESQEDYYRYLEALEEKSEIDQSDLPEEPNDYDPGYCCSGCMKCLGVKW